MKKLSSKSLMDIWWQRIASALAFAGGISATYVAWFELPGIKSDNKDFKEDLKNQTEEYNRRFDTTIKEYNRRFDISIKEYKRRFDTSITLGVTVPITVSLVMGSICLLSRK